jgi:cellulose biosynthesis protein BcsQ
LAERHASGNERRIAGDFSGKERKERPLLNTKYRDDIAAICAEVGLEPSRYVEFAPRVKMAAAKGSDLEALRSALEISDKAKQAAAGNAIPAEVSGHHHAERAHFSQGHAESYPTAQAPAGTTAPHVAANRWEPSPAAPPPSAQPPSWPTTAFQEADLRERVNGEGVARNLHSEDRSPTQHQPLHARIAYPENPRPTESTPGPTHVSAEGAAVPLAAKGTQPVYGQRRGLQSVLQSNPNLPAKILQPRHLARPVIVAPAASGMGCTTLVATLGRYFQSRNEKVLILDDTRDDLLQLHFEYSRSPETPDFARKESSAIPIMNRESVPGLSAQLSQNWFLEPLARFQLDYQWILLDASTLAPALVQAPLGGGAIFLVPLMPDMRSVHKGVRLLDEVDAFEREMDRRLEVQFVLNQFDERNGFHVELKEHLNRRLGHRLAPITIRRSQDVEEALAEGMTVLEYAPESEVAADFRTLAHWIEQQR